MRDARLRELERLAAVGGPEDAEQFLNARVRASQIGEAEDAHLVAAAAAVLFEAIQKRQARRAREGARNPDAEGGACQIAAELVNRYVMSLNDEDLRAAVVNAESRIRTNCWYLAFSARQLVLRVATDQVRSREERAP